MSIVRIVIIDDETGQTVKTMKRSFEDTSAADAAEEIRDAIDSDTFADNVDDAD